MNPPSLTQALALALTQNGPAGLRAACAQALMDMRGLDPPGAEAALTEDSQASALFAQAVAEATEQAAAALGRRLRELALAQACLGCGACCRTSSPTLYAEDLKLLGPQGLARAGLITLRAGERAFSARLGRAFALERELIKLRESPAGGCLHLKDFRCGIYDLRPRQCRHLECWSGRHAGQLEDLARLARADIYAGDQTALALIEEFEAKLPAARLAGWLEQAAQGDAQALAEALAAMELEHRLRAGISARYGYPADELDLLLGRPGWEVARSYGLGLGVDSQGRPRLSPLSGEA